MSDSSQQESDRLAAAMIAAFPEYLRRRVGDLGLIAGPGVQAAIGRATDQLARDLTALLAAPAAAQTESPLQLCRDATEPVSLSLIDMGFRPPGRDAWERESHPEDRFGLFPASSNELGEEAWRLHLQWGVDKARALAAVTPDGDPPAKVPSVALFGVAVEDRDVLSEAIAGRGYRVLQWRNPAALTEATVERPVLAIVDLRHPEAHSAIRKLSDDGIRVIATAAYIDDLMRPGVLALGAKSAVEFGRVLSRLDDLLPRVI